MGIKIDEFINKYKGRNDEDKLLILGKHLKKEYVPIEVKEVEARRIIEACYYKTNEDGTRELMVDSVGKYMLTGIAMMNLYTDLDSGAMTTLDTFNALNAVGFFRDLQTLVDVDEMEEFVMIINMVADDVMKNEYGVSNFIKAQVEKIGRLLVPALQPVLEKTDWKELIEVLKEAAQG